MDFNKQNLRTGEEVPSFNHSAEVVENLVSAEERLLALERNLQERLLRGDGKQAEGVHTRLASILGKKKPVVAEQTSVREVQQEIQDEIEEDDYLQALYSHKYANTNKAVRDCYAVDRALKEAEAIQIELEAELSRNGAMDISTREALDEVKRTILLLEDDRESLLESSPESYYVGNLMHLRELKRQALQGSIIETESVYTKRRQIEGFALAGRPIFLHGAPGTGKTEMAIHVAKHLPTAQAYLNKARYESKDGAQPYMIISASKQTDSSELTGHQIIHVKQMPDDERKAFIDAVEAEMNEWLLKNENATEEQKGRQQQLILEAYKLTHGQGMETSFWTGPMYKCMEEGIPFIVDEANAMPPDVLIKINHLMTRRPGDKVVVQEDSGKEITIKEGFCFIFTGNIGEQFQGRYRLEQSFVNRIGDAMIEYDYLPDDELKEVLFAYLMEGKKAKGSLVMDPSDLDSVESFAYAASFAQKVFAGKEDVNIPDGSGGSLSVRDHKLLKNTPLSMRNIFNIVEAFKRDNQSKPFEQYIYDSFIKPIQDPGERYTYFAIFQLIGMFNGTLSDPRRDASGKVVEFETNGSVSMIEKEDNYHVFTPRDVVDRLYGPYEFFDAGYTPSKKRNYHNVPIEDSPEINGETLEMNKLLAVLDSQMEALSQYIQKQEVAIGSVCPTS